MSETIEDIVGDIRAQNQGLSEDGYALSPLVCDLLSFADRIEAAHKREREATCTESLQVGNAAAMRETLLRCDAIAQLPEIREYTIVKEMRNLIKGAISVPSRNCDVGSAKEQSVRMSEFCREQYKKSDGIMLCSGCRFHNMEGLDCQFAWAQMPYEGEVADGD